MKNRNSALAFVSVGLSVILGLAISVYLARGLNVGTAVFFGFAIATFVFLIHAFIATIRQNRFKEQRFRSLVEATTAIVWDTPASGEFEEPQPSWTAFTGQSFAELRGWGWLNAVHPDDRAVTAQVWSAAVANLRIYEVEHRLRANDQSFRNMMVRAVPIVEKGRIVQWIGVHTDITETKRAEQELLWKTALMEAQVNASVDAIFVIDENGRRILQNQRVAELLRIPDRIPGVPEDEIQLGWISDQTKNPLEFLAKARHLMAHPDEVCRDEIEFKDGTVLDRYSGPVLGKGGEYYGRLVTLRDITERKRSEDALNQRDALIRIAGKVTRTGGWIMEVPSRRLAWSDEIFTLLGYHQGATPSLQDALGLHPQPWQELVTAALETCVRDGTPFDLEVQILAAGGRMVWGRVCAEAERDADGSIKRVQGAFQDITERRRTEEALREVEERYRSILDNASEGFFQNTPEGGFLFANAALARILGFDNPQELILERTDIRQQGYVDPIQRDLFQRLLEEKGAVTNFEYEVKRKDGRTICVSENVRLVRNATGEPLYYEGSVQDITERQRAAADLQRQQTELRVLFDLMPAMVWFKDTQNNQLRVNQRVADAVGKSVEEIEGRSCDDTYPQEAAGYYADDLEVMRTGVPKLGIVEKVRDAQAREIFVQTDKVPYCDKDGRVIGIIVMAQDITERKKAEESLRLLGSAVEQSRESIVITDAVLDHPGPRIVFVNPAYTAMTGYTAEEALGATPRALQGPRTDPAVLRRLRGNLERGENFAGETINYRKDGSEFTIEWQTAPIRDGAGTITHFVAIQRDISERKRLESQLLESQKMEVVGKLAGGIAHEFNSILTAIIGQSELLQSDLTAGSPVAERATEINTAAKRAAGLTRQLLAYGRKQSLQSELVDLNQVLSRLEGMLHHLLGDRVDIRIVPALELHAAKVDSGQLEQVIMNMAINAGEAMPAGGRLTFETANVSVAQDSIGRYAETKPGNYVMLAVTDTGTGMSVAVKERVFEPFFSTKGVGKGTGLGLSTCYGIIKQSGGYITVYSEPARGAIFKIYLPCVEDRAPSSTPVPGSTDLPTGSETILLVEDEPALRDMAAALLRRLGYKILAAANGVEALTLSLENGVGSIDLVFTDLAMPLISGEELSVRMRALHPNIRILFTSAYTRNVVTHQGLLNGDFPLLPKPFTPSALAQKLRAVLDRPPLPAAISDK